MNCFRIVAAARLLQQPEPDVRSDLLKGRQSSCESRPAQFSLRHVTGRQCRIEVAMQPGSLAIWHRKSWIEHDQTDRTQANREYDWEGRPARMALASATRAIQCIRFTFVQVIGCCSAPSVRGGPLLPAQPQFEWSPRERRSADCPLRQQLLDYVAVWSCSGCGFMKPT